MFHKQQMINLSYYNLYYFRLVLFRILLQLLVLFQLRTLIQYSNYSYVYTKSFIVYTEPIHISHSPAPAPVARVLARRSRSSPARGRHRKFANQSDFDYASKTDCASQY